MGLFKKSAGEKADSGQKSAQRAIAAFNQGNPAKCVDLMNDAIAQGLPEDFLPLATTILGNAYDRLDRFEEAKAAHEQALALDGQNHQIWVNLGVAHRHTGEYEKAEHCYEEALKLRPEYAEAHESLGVLYVTQGKVDRAIDAFHNALSLNPNLALAHGNLALALAMKGDFEEADRELKVAVAAGYPNGREIARRIAELRALDTGS